MTGREDDTACAREFLRQIRKPPCEQCLRPASPCRERCLRSILTSENCAGTSADAIEAHRCRLAIHHHHPFQSCLPPESDFANSPFGTARATAIWSLFSSRGVRRNEDEAIQRHCMPVRLLRHQPLQCDCCGEPFNAGDVVLMPRPEAELLVQIGDAVLPP
jgi:hypothetical protein